MGFRRSVITGGAGFVGASLAVRFRQSFPDADVVALDNLSRQGSALNLPRLHECGVLFQRGDARDPEDLAAAGDFDLLVHCAAETSVQAGLHDSPARTLDNNLVGTLKALEAARARGAAFLLMSTSRVYPMQRLNSIPWRETETRYEWADGSSVAGVEAGGITEAFPLDGARSFYGASKLASELVAEEFAYSFGMPVLINRCAVVAGPWQMWKMDQGVIALWVARHFFKRPLRYLGFGGLGKQVRDVLHVDDLCALTCRQLEKPDLWDGRRYNIGGGGERAISLRELTEICRRVTGNRIAVDGTAASSTVDVRIYITNASRAAADFAWAPTRSVQEVVEDLYCWMRRHEAVLREHLDV